VCEIVGLPTHAATVIFTIAFVFIVFANIKELMYFSVKVFSYSILTIFFSSMEVLGRENIPQHGPIIFTGNHMNQFVDGAVLVVTTPQKVSFLVAEKSYNKRIIGDFAKAVGAIPVSRPQDMARKGPGKLKFDRMKVIGEGTEFTKLQKGDKIRPGKSPEAYKFKTIISDTEGILTELVGETSPMLETHAQGKWTTYDILGYVDQSKMFEAVQATLAKGSCLGIFPEGGSHDRTDLLPLKAGVAAIALGVREKYGINVPIVPVGLNYFRGHHFRGRCVVEFGSPIIITDEVMELYASSRQSAYQALLHEVEDGMRSVIVTAKDYNELKLIHTIRRLYQRSSLSTSRKEKQDLARRFAEAAKIMREKFKESLPEDITQLIAKVDEYQSILDKWGLKDYQLQSDTFSAMSFTQMLYTFLHGASVILLASVPSIILNVGFAANYWAYQEAKKDLEASRVKIQAKDVLLSKKMMFSIVAVPVLWVTYAVLLLLLTSLQVKTVIVLLLCCPIFSYMGVMAVEASMNDLKDLRPAFLRLLPSFLKIAPELPKKRAELVEKVRNLVKKYGPSLGAVYTDPSRDWEQAANAPSTITNMENASNLDHASLLLNSITSLDSDPRTTNNALPSSPEKSFSSPGEGKKKD
jgi:glycerol-3-phosphate O-acyltransferase/dihydroxyacetone phosphate acyltransferase